MRPAALNPSQRKRLSLLTGGLALCLVALGIQRIWFNPTPREPQLARMSVQQLEKEAARKDDPLVQYYLARKKLELGQADQGFAALEEALKIDPKFSRARATLGSLLVSIGRDQEALLHLRQAIQDDPASTDAYLGLAMLYQGQEAWRRQFQAADAAIQSDPKNVQAWLLRGDAVLRQRDYGKALADFEHAAALDPGSAAALVLASEAAMQLGKLAEAERHAEAAVAAAPKDPNTHTQLGQALLLGGAAQRERARAAFERATSLGETSGRAYTGLGTVLQSEGKHLEAEQQFRFALRADPSLNSARYALARSLRALGRSAEAKQVDAEFQKWDRFEQQRVKLHDRVALQPDEAKHWVALARLYRDMELWEPAHKAVLSAIRRNPADTDASRLLSEIESHFH
ncbi:MAG: tetratricopeptide repeat protein [Armatimonadota bacterium]